MLPRPRCRCLSPFPRLRIPMPPPPALLVLVTCPPAAATAIATALVEARTAACVNLLPGVTSVYRWQGAIERAGETLLIAKTTADGYAAVEATVRAAHPYELPEIVAVSISAGLPAYLQWLADSVAAPGAPP
jgi:periplasmic divalent cation tolerance protein